MKNYGDPFLTKRLVQKGIVEWVFGLSLRSYGSVPDDSIYHYCMLFFITQIWFNVSDYATLHSIMNIMTENGAKTMYQMPQ